MGVTVLVTGGAGYVGSHAVKALRRAGHRVVVFDNLSAGHRGAVLGGPLIEGDIRDEAAVRRAIRESGATAVMHFAALLNVAESVSDPVGYYATNVAGTLATLAAMAAEGCRLFVFSSSCAVYGNPRALPIAEDHPTAPVNAYGQTKLAIEHALPHFERAYGMRWTALRYFNAGGADPEGELGECHDPEIHLIPRVLDAATTGGGVDVYGRDYPTPDGTCLRDYVHVADLAEAHVLALDRLCAGRESTALNLGTERPSSVLDVIAAVERVTGGTVEKRWAPRRAGDPAELCAATGRARAELGWQPQRPGLEAIVADAWRWRVAHPRGFTR